MIYKMYSDEQEILDSQTVILFNESADLTIEVKLSTTFSFKLIFEFKKSNNGKRDLKLIGNENELRLICLNFTPKGSGTVAPIQLATLGERKVYLNFWVSQDMPEMRRVNYTLYVEKAGGTNNE